MRETNSKSNITISKGGTNDHSSVGGTQAITTTALTDDAALRKTFAVINQMVRDGIIKTYALGGAMAAALYVEPTATQDMDLFCTLTYEAEGNAIVLLTPITDYLKSKGYETHGIGVMIEGTEVQFQLPSDSLGVASIENAKTIDFQGVPVKVMTPEYLVAHMLTILRDKDKFRLNQFLAAGAFDPPVLSSILTEHGLDEKWAILEKMDEQIGK